MTYIISAESSLAVGPEFANDSWNVSGAIMT